MDLDIGDTFFESWASYYQTPKGYMTQSSMLFLLKEIVSPYDVHAALDIGQKNGHG